MTHENQSKLLQASTFALQAEQDGIADLLEDVILGEMEPRPATKLRGYTPMITTLDDIPPVPAYGSRHVVTCEQGKEVTS